MQNMQNMWNKFLGLAVPPHDLRGSFSFWCLIWQCLFIERKLQNKIWNPGCAKYARYAKYETMQIICGICITSICEIWAWICKQYADIVHIAVYWQQYAKYAKQIIICTICKICKHYFNMQNMHSPLCWWSRRNQNLTRRPDLDHGYIWSQVEGISWHKRNGVTRTPQRRGGPRPPQPGQLVLQH